jgi:hypothetical protein
MAGVTLWGFNPIGDGGFFPFFVPSVCLFCLFVPAAPDNDFQFSALIDRQM